MSPLSPEAERRRRLITRTLPITALALGAFVTGALLGSPSDEREVAERFALAWERGDYASMRAELTPEAARRYPRATFTRLYEQARTTSTATEIDTHDPQEPDALDGLSVVRIPVEVETVAFGNVSGSVAVQLEDGRIAWRPNLVFPGLEPGEVLERQTRIPERAAILARDGTPLAEGPAASRSSPIGAAAQQVVGTVGVPRSEAAEALAGRGFPPGSLAGTSGLELAFNDRLSGRPGGRLLAVPGRGADPSDPGAASRVLAQSAPVPGMRVRTTIDPALQRAAAGAIGTLLGGIAVLDARTGAVRALAGLAYSAPQPPGSTFKVVTTVAALEGRLVRLDEEFPVATGATVGGREIANAHDEACGGTFVQSFAHSCNSVFAPLGAEVGSEKLVETAERFGFNQPPTLFGPDATAVVDPPASTIPDPIGSELEVAVSAIGQGEVLATPLQLASISQTIAAGGIRRPTPIVSDRELRASAQPVRVTTSEIARTVRDLMVEVVRSGTGTAAAIPRIQVAGKTGTAELGPAPTAPAPPPGSTPVQEVDAWFTAFAPAERPKLAVAVMVVDAEGGGGEVAAPIAREVLAAGLVS